MKFIDNIINKNYIEFDYSNSQWNSGTISVYIKGELIEYIFVDNDEGGRNSYDIIESFKEKYNLTKVIEIKGYDWR